jgi:tRNA(Ile)-lysidine synthase
MALSLADRARAAIHKRQMLQAGDRVAVAVSGGADSVALLLLLLELRDKLGIVLSVVHFNHKLRGTSSDADEKFVAKLAGAHGLALHVDSADVASRAKRDKANLEDAARRSRYGFFAQLVEQGHLTRVAVAHTADDQAETVLAHILRGTGLAGLGGIHPIAGHVVRPLLEIRRAELRAYLRAKKQRWREDATNRDTTKTRARIRRKLLPLLEKQFQPAVVEHLGMLAELAREDEAFFDALTESQLAAALKKESGVARIPISVLRGRGVEAEGSEKTTLTKRMIRRIVKELKPRAGQVEAKHVEAVLQLAERSKSGKSIALPGGLQVRRERDTLLFQPNSKGRAAQEPKPIDEYQHVIHFDSDRQEAIVLVSPLRCVFRFTVIDWLAKRGETSVIGPVLDRDTLRLPLVLRNWRPGDVFRPLGHQKPHKIKRLLNEKHISRWERDGWPVLTSGGVLAWARGFPVAAEFAASERTRAGIVIAEESQQ